jgi:hypothetical protein
MFLRDNPEIAVTIERAIRQNAGFIAEKFLERSDDSETAADNDDALEA